MPDSAETADARGYITDVPYTIKFYARQVPHQLVTAAQVAGVATPALDRPFTYADFGCGRGMTLLVLASIYPESRFFGIDVNAEHVEEAQARADRAGLSNLRFLARSFGGIGADELPPLDLATAHGVYSWVGEDVRADLCKAIADHLQPEGLAMVSYNTRAGYASMDPLQQLLMHLAEVAPGSLVEKRRAAIALVRRMWETKQSFFERYPSAEQRVGRWPKHDESYLFHEYFNAYWQPLSFAEVAGDMRAVGLHFCGDALYQSWRSGKGREAQADWLKDPVMLEELACVSNAQAFRYDLFTKSRAFELGRPSRIPGQALFGVSQPAQTGEVTKAATGSSKVNRLIAALAKGPLTMAEIEASPLFAGASPLLAPTILRAAMAQGLVAQYKDGSGGAGEVGIGAGLEVSTTLGKALIEDPGLASQVLPMPAPRLGSAVMVPPLIAAVLFAAQEGEADLAERTARRVDALTGAGKDGRKRESFESIHKRSQDAVERFRKHWVAHLLSSQVVRRL